MSRIIARRRKASAVRARFSTSLARRRQRFNQLKVRSTIHRFGSTRKPVAPGSRATTDSTQPYCPATQPMIEAWNKIDRLGEDAARPHRVTYRKLTRD